MNSNLLINGYGPAAVIVLGYIIAAYWQAKRFEDMKDVFMAKLDAMNTKIDKVESTLNARIEKLEGILYAKLDALEWLVKSLADEIHSPLVKR